MPGHATNRAKKEQRKRFKAKHPEGRKAFAKEKRELSTKEEKRKKKLALRKPKREEIEKAKRAVRLKRREEQLKKLREKPKKDPKWKEVKQDDRFTVFRKKSRGKPFKGHI